MLRGGIQGPQLINVTWHGGSLPLVKEGALVSSGQGDSPLLQRSYDTLCLPCRGSYVRAVRKNPAISASVVHIAWLGTFGTVRTVGA